MILIARNSHQFSQSSVAVSTVVISNRLNYIKVNIIYYYSTEIIPSISKRNDNLPVGKESHVNSPKLTSAVKRSGFFDNSVVSEYHIHDSTFKY